MFDDQLDIIPSSATVLVAVVTRPADLDHARAAGWYRIPVSRAPRGIAVEHIAFYQTAAFGSQRWAVRFVAPVRAVTIARRCDLLPDEAQHPRANERYYRFALGPLWELPAPVPSRRLRRISFIPTTWGQLLNAHDVAELWQHAQHDTAAELWAAGVVQRRSG